MARKKIIILPSWYPTEAVPHNGIFVRDQAECLAERFDVTVLVPELVGWRSWWAGKRARPSSGQPVEWLLPQRVLPLWQRRWPFHHAFHAGSDAHVWHTLRLTRIFARGLRQYIAVRGKPDLIHAHVVLPAGSAAVQLGRKWDIPVVLTEHSGPFATHLETARRRELVAATLTQCRKVLAVSPSLAETMRESFPRISVEVRGNVIRTRHFSVSPPSPCSRIRFLALAALVPDKGIQYFLEAAALLRARGVCRFEIVIGGDGPLREQLEALAARHGLTGQCRFLGTLSRTDVRREMQACDVFVLPSLGESFSVVVGEAQACGKPVIATRCGGPEWLVTPETGVLVPCAAAEPLADAMDRFIDSPPRFDPFTIRRSVCERFGEEAFLDGISAVYDEVLDGVGDSEPAVLCQKCV